MEWGANAQAFLAVVVTGVAALLGAVSIASYVRLRNARALLIGLGFLAFAVQGAYLVHATIQGRGTDPWVTWVATLDLVGLVLMYVAIRRP